MIPPLSGHSRRLLYASEVEAAQASRYAQVRTKLLAIPAERAPHLHWLKTVAEVQDYLLDAVTEALEALSPNAAR